MISLAKILRHNIIGKLLNHVIVFCINILIVRLLGAGESGAYFNELYLLNFMVFACSMGLDYMTINFLSVDARYISGIRKTLLAVSIGFSLLIIALCYLFLPAISQVTQPAIAVIFFSIGNLVLIFYQGLLSAMKKFNLQNVILAISNACFLIFLWLNFKDSQVHFSELAIAYACLFLIQGILMFMASHSGMQAHGKLKLDHGDFFRRGIFIMCSSIIYFGFLRVDNFFVEKYCTDVELGNYVQCGKIGQYFIYFSSIISSTLLPFIATETVGSSYKEWLKIIRPYLLLLVVAGISIASTGAWMFPFLFGEAFEDMNRIMLILLPGFICLGLLTLINSVYIGKGNIRTIFIGDLAGLLLLLLLDGLLIPAYGIYAAAAISSGCYILLFVFLLAGFKKQFLRHHQDTIVAI